ncbi:MAG: enolase C-terminal domain-like protein [Myxococcaceae bacterium]
MSYVKNVYIQPFSLKLIKPLNLRRRVLNSSDSMIYEGQFIRISEGYGELIKSQRLAEELAGLHLSIIENHFRFEPIHEQIPLAGMIESVDISEAQYLVSQGFKTLKFKVGKDWALEAENLQEVRYQIGPEIDIRLDANRAFNLEDAVLFGKRIENLRIAYFEEPLQNILEIPEFVQATRIPVALDESLLEENIPELEGISTYALKPFLMPDLQSIFACIELAQKREIDIAICSAFESPYSLNWLVLLAAMIPGKLLPAGLSTYRWFEGEPLRATFSAREAYAMLQRKS